MNDFAGIFTILIFLFYVFIAGIFVFAALRKWVWPFIRALLPARRSQQPGRHTPSADRHQRAS